jgi:hypothetical protein
MKLEATLTAIAVLIALGFAFSRNAYLMGAMVFVATPLVIVSATFYLRRVLSDLGEQDH